MPTAKKPPVHNRLLAALPARARSGLLGRARLVELELGQVLVEPGARIGQVLFPVTGFVSLVALRGGENPLEVGLVGDEGVLGATLALGADAAAHRWLVQGAGTAWSLSPQAFQRELARSPALRRHLDRYLYVRLLQLSQAAICTRFHLVEARLARWLLMTRDRAHADHFHITHDFIAYMLGVRRVGITRAASALGRLRLIRYSRGNLEILDNRGLEGAACDCYRADEDSYRRFML